MQFYCKPCSAIVRTRGPSNKATQQAVVAAAKASSTTNQKAEPKAAAAAPKANPTPAAASKPAAAAAAPSGGVFTPATYLSYSALKDNLFDKNQVDTSQKEMYLSDEDFSNMFKMTRAQFAALPAWKKKQKKQEFGIF